MSSAKLAGTVLRYEVTAARSKLFFVSPSHAFTSTANFVHISSLGVLFVV